MNEIGVTILMVNFGQTSLFLEERVDDLVNLNLPSIGVLEVLSK
jgi:hypothetical protein